MPKWNVEFTIDYQVDAETMEEAQERAEQLLAEEFENPYCGLTELFDVEVSNA